jgi:hypothetical protein
LPADEGVQLIVFFAPIREILRKGIYGSDKECFWTMKTKGIFSALKGVAQAKANALDSVYE